MTSLILNSYDAVVERLRGMGEYVPRLVMRLVMGWEFFEAGLEKLRGENWFSNIQGDFPFPFDPMELGEAALLELFGYQLEGVIIPGGVKPETIPLAGFRRTKPWWKLW